MKALGLELPKRRTISLTEDANDAMKDGAKKLNMTQFEYISLALENFDPEIIRPMVEEYRRKGELFLQQKRKLESKLKHLSPEEINDIMTRLEGENDDDEPEGDTTQEQ